MDALEKDPSAQGWIADVLVRSSEFAVIRIDLKGTIVGWHGAAERLFGFASAEICGRPFADLFTEEDRALGLFDTELEVAGTATRSEDDRWHVRKSGGRFWGSGVVERLHGPDGTLTGFVKVLRDRTDLRTRYQTLQNRLDIAQRLVNLRRSQLAMLVHELRNPLSPLVHAAKLLRAAGEAPIDRETLDVIERQVDLMRRLLTEATLEAVPRSAPLREIGMVQVLRVVVTGCRTDAETAGVSVDLVVPSGEIHLQADTDHLHQMVMNLVNNSIKYTPRGGRVVVSASVEGDLAVVRVDDNGVGIDAENLRRIFDMFVREDHADIPGLGVGLSVVKSLATLHGGFVEARSPGRGLGTQMSLHLPLRQKARHTR